MFFVLLFEFEFAIDRGVVGGHIHLQITVCPFAVEHIEIVAESVIAYVNLFGGIGKDPVDQTKVGVIIPIGFG